MVLAGYQIMKPRLEDMMAKDPAFLLYTSDFLTGTALMTNTEVGQYITILCHLADKGTLSLEEIKFLLKGDPADKVLSKLKKKTSGRYFNQRLEDEVNKRKEYAKSRRDNRLSKTKPSTHVKHMSIHMEDVNRDRDIIKSFNILYSKYPKKVGRKDAMRHFKASVKTDDDIKSINLALDHYINSKRVLSGYVQNASTWFNNWQDWIEYEEKLCMQCKGKGVFISSTGYEIHCDCQKVRV